MSEKNGKNGNNVPDVSYDPFAPGLAPEVDNPVFNTIRVPLGYRWSRAVRGRIKEPRFKTVFDVETDPRYTNHSVEYKTDIVNATYDLHGEDAYEHITPAQYEAVCTELYRNRTTLSAMVYMYMGLWADQNIFDDLHTMHKKALEHDDPSKLMGIYSFIDKRLKHIEDSRLLKEFFEQRAKEIAARKKKEAQPKDITHDPLSSAPKKEENLPKS